MKLTLLASALLATSLGASAAGPTTKQILQKERQQARKEVAAQKATESLATVTDNGDADSFGRNVKFIGLMTTGLINLAADCTPDPAFPPGPDDHCFVTNAAPAVTNFTVNDAARMLIPAKSANSLFCHWQTPFVVYTFHNPTASIQYNGRFVLTPSYVIQNEVLNDPAIIDPATGLPANGQIVVSLAGIRRGRSLQPGEFQTERENGTRACSAGLVSKRALMESYGLSAAKADKFFNKDTVITMNITGSAAEVEFANIFYGTRFVSD